MRKSLFIIGMVVWGVLAVGCSRDDGPESSGYGIGYSTGVWDDGEDTKAAVTTGENITGKGNIRVYSYIMNALAGSTAGSSYFSADLVYSGGAWNSTPVRYWPAATVGGSASKSLSFFACQPTDAVQSWSDSGYQAGSDTKPGFSYTAPVSVSQQKDLLCAVSEFNTYESCDVTVRWPSISGMHFRK